MALRSTPDGDYVELHQVERSQSPRPEPSDDSDEMTPPFKHSADADSLEASQHWVESMDTSRLFTIAALALCYVGSQIDSFFKGPAMVFIAKDLQIGDNLAWVSTCGGVAQACVVPCAGYLQDLIGRRGTLALGLLFLLVGIILTALAKSFAYLIAGGVIAGIGGGISELTAIAAISELVPMRSRGFYLGLVNMLTVIFTPAVLYAQEISDHASWRWLFWISLIWNGTATLLTAVTYFRMKLDRMHPTAPLDTIKQLDYLGVTLFSVGIIEILVAINAGGQSYSWTSAYVLVQLLVGCACIGAFIFWESRGCGRPLMPFRMFSGQRVVGLTYIISFFAAMPYTAGLNLVTIINESVFQFSPLRTGIIALGPSIALAIGAFGGNFLLSLSKGRAREVLLVSTVLMTAFTGAQAVISPTQSTTWAIVASFSSLGIGATLVPASTVVSLACPQDLIGTAVAFTIAIRTVGGTVGYAILYNIFATNSKARVPSAIAKAAHTKTPSVIEKLAQVFESNSAAARAKAASTLGAKTVAAAQLAYQYATSEAGALVFYATIPLGLVTVVAALFLPNMESFTSKRVLTRTKSTLVRVKD